MVDGAGGIGGTPPLPNNLATMDPYTLLEVLSMDRANALQQSTQDQAAEIQQKNAQIQKLNDALEKLNAAKTSNDKSGDTLNNSNGQVDQAVAELQSLGIDPSSYISKDSSGNWKNTKDNGTSLLIETTKTQIDSVSSDSQLDMIKLQGLINKQSEAEQMASGAESKRDQVASSIIQKIS